MNKLDCVVQFANKLGVMYNLTIGMLIGVGYLNSKNLQDWWNEFNAFVAQTDGTLIYDDHSVNSLS
ncbi:hypothetical protein CR513_04677, partial [Mucuna pruriens]